MLNGTYLEDISDPKGRLFRNTPNKLYRNNGNETFTDVSREAGVDNNHWSMAAGTMDYDGDSDVDIYSDSDVLWAISTRTQPDRDMFVVPECMGSPLDPSTRGKGGITARMGIDATKKPVGEPFSEVCEVPTDLLEKMKVEDYLHEFKD